MSFAREYLERNPSDLFTHLPPPHPDLSVIVIIPACNESQLDATLHSLQQCDRPQGAVEVLLFVNAPDSAPTELLEQNRRTLLMISDFRKQHEGSHFRIYAAEGSIPDARAGAGEARKISMDAALRRFHALGRGEGLILSMDADTLCDPDYLRTIEARFREDPHARACSVYFEHPLEGREFSSEVYAGITQYELHLRYFIEALRHAGHPHAYHTIGSAFAVRARDYAAQGGMNRRKAGEDFYFLHKMIPLGGFREINDTRVIPSPRPSDRVAFGTGPVIRRFSRGEFRVLPSYHPAVFEALSTFIDRIPEVYHMKERERDGMLSGLPDSLRLNLQEEWRARIREIRQNAASEASFRKRFFRWFGIFRVLKYINAAHRDHHKRLPVQDALEMFYRRKGMQEMIRKDAREQLYLMRKVQRRFTPPAQ